jgi:uncharacterized membrane protein
MTVGEIMVWHVIGFYAIGGWLLFSWINKKLNKRRDKIFDRILDIPMVSFEEFHDRVEKPTQGTAQVNRRHKKSYRKEKI